jgi:hypothetical protein
MNREFRLLPGQEIVAESEDADQSAYHVGSMSGEEKKQVWFGKVFMWTHLRNQYS